MLETDCLWHDGITRSISYSVSSNRLIVYCLSFRLRIIQSLRDVTIVGVGLQNLCDCSAFLALRRDRFWSYHTCYDTEPGLHDITRKTGPFSRLLCQGKGTKDTVWPAFPRVTKLRTFKMKNWRKQWHCPWLYKQSLWNLLHHLDLPISNPDLKIDQIRKRISL